jgi:pimeloyl-ACP methyl ester carboxylesterase
MPTRQPSPTRSIPSTRIAFAIAALLALAAAFAWGVVDRGAAVESGAAAATTLAGGGALRHLVRPHGTLAYDERGDGPLVVMLPGLGDLRQQYRFLAPELAVAGYRVVTADLRGHGESSTGWPEYTSEAAGEDLLALLAELDGGPAVVVGNSFGAAPAVWAASERPEAVAGLVLIGPFVREHDTSPAMRAALRVMLGGPWKVRAWGWFYGTLYRSARPDDFDAYRAALLANLAEPGRFEAVRGMVFRSDAAIEARLDRVRAPTLVVMGSEDPDFPDPAEEARAVAEAVAGEVIMVEGAGHYPHVEMPEVTGPIVMDFVRSAFARR